nr:hypothetical protein HHOCTOMJ_HHOCTOMJ_CDS_0008 [Microvirus sp.]
MGEVLKDAYENEFKKRQLKEKFGGLMYRYAVLCGMLKTYQAELDNLNKDIEATIKEVSNENS